MSKIREAFPDKLILIGGHHATVFPQQVIKHNCFDILIYGEGELTMLELMEKYKMAGCNRKKFLSDYKTLKQIKGIVFREKNAPVTNEPREFVQDMDDLPFPAMELMPIHLYNPPPDHYKRLPLFHMIVIRGCPYNCAFCSNNYLFGRRIRKKSPKRVIEEIKNAVRKFGARDISFWDDMLTADKQWLTDVCNLLIDEQRNGLDITWTCFSRVNTVTPELLKLMKKAGCWGIFYGFESGNQELLDIINKGITLEQSRNAAKWTQEAGIDIRASFMIGMPGETKEMALKTIQFAKELNTDYPQFCRTSILPGTELFKMYKQYGRLLIDNEEISEENCEDIIFFIPWDYKDFNEIRDMERRAIRTCYFNLKYIFMRLRKLRSIEDIRRNWEGIKRAWEYVS